MRLVKTHGNGFGFEYEQVHATRIAVTHPVACRIEHRCSGGSVFMRRLVVQAPARAVVELAGDRVEVALGDRSEIEPIDQRSIPMKNGTHASQAARQAFAGRVQPRA